MKRFLYLQSPQRLSALPEACLSLTPKVSECALKPPLSDSVGESVVFLEISSTEKFFGGEEKILSLAEEIFNELSWRGQVVLTDRPEWGLAFATQPRSLMAPGQSRKQLQGLPIQRLGFCGDPWKISEELDERADLTKFLRKVGLRFIADYLKLPLPSVQKRFGKMGSYLHDWANGKRELILPLYFPTEPIRENMPTEDIGGLDPLLHSLRQLLARVETRLKGRGLAATKVELSFSLESRQVLKQRVQLKEPVQSAGLLWGLLREYLQNSTLSWDSPLQDLEVGIVETAPQPKGQLSLFDDRESRLGELSEFMTRMQARLGENRIGLAECLPSYLPEQSSELIWPRVKASSPDLHCPASRPFFLYDPPRACQPNRSWKMSPTEKVTENWWETNLESRDQERTYFIAVTPQSQRLWVFWSKKQQKWFLQGAYD